jgi:hypothetical protein
VGQNIRRLLQKIWEEDTMTPKQNKYYIAHFRVERGVRQPTIFNIIIDAVIRTSEEEMKDEEKLKIIFYANNGLFGGLNHLVVQRALGC